MNKKKLFQTLMLEFPKAKQELYNFFKEEEEKILKTKTKTNEGTNKQK